MKNRRNIRKRQFETNKYLKLYRTYTDLYAYIHGKNSSDGDLERFEAQERYENKDKIAEMFCKKKQNVPIPEINNAEKSDKCDASERTAITEIMNYARQKEEEGSAEFYFKPMGPLPDSYIKYTPKMTPLNFEETCEKIDYMVTEDDWIEIKSTAKGVTDNMKDMIEEIIDKLEKLTAKGEIKSFEECRNTLSSIPLKTKNKFPSENVFRVIYTAWVALRKKTGNALLRKYWKRSDPNDNSPIASFRSRVPDKMITRRKNKNDKNNYMKLKLLK
mmetsp:Transcript_15069/g.17446  ORF Transcript_15069/g.17446 Transcript_15069/m.17446 type:complete len:274 (+) Transcript_15069:60-881(+)